MSPRPLSVLVVDDSTQFRAGLTALLSAVDGFELAGEAADGEAAVALAIARQPDVVLMDLHMPGCGGIEATRAIVASVPHVAVLVLTMDDGDASVFEAMQVGARGYLVKGARQRELLRALDTVSDGGAVFGPQVAHRMADFFARRAAVRAEEPFPELTAREREVLQLIAMGRNNHQIAEQLGLSTKTVRNNVSNIFNKLRVVDRGQAIVRAREAGIGGR
jgi:DNA-binding NarL/FixJ family response regulator